MRFLMVLILLIVVTPILTIADPNAGEQINWQLIGGSGSSGSSANFQVSGSLGQAAAGFVSGSTIDVNQGFWQDFGSGCCEGTTGNVNMSGIVDLTDLSMLIGYLTISPKPVLPCPEEANVNGASIIDLTDLSMLIGYLTLSPKPVLPNCP